MLFSTARLCRLAMSQPVTTTVWPSDPFFAGSAWQWSSMVLEIAPIFKGLVKMSLEFRRWIAANVATEVTTPLFV